MLLFAVSFIIIFGSLSFPVTAKRTVHDVDSEKRRRASENGNVTVKITSGKLWELEVGL